MRRHHLLSIAIIIALLLISVANSLSNSGRGVPISRLRAEIFKYQRSLARPSVIATITSTHSPLYAQTPGGLTLILFNSEHISKDLLVEFHRVIDDAMSRFRGALENLEMQKFSSAAYRQCFLPEEYSRLLGDFERLSKRRELVVAFDTEPFAEQLYPEQIGLGTPSELYPRSGFIFSRDLVSVFELLDSHDKRVFEYMNLMIMALGKRPVFVHRDFNFVQPSMRMVTHVREVESVWLLRDIHANSISTLSDSILSKYQVTGRPRHSSYSLAVFADLIPKARSRRPDGIPNTIDMSFWSAYFRQFFVDIDESIIESRCDAAGIDKDSVKSSINLAQYYFDTEYLRKMNPQLASDWYTVMRGYDPCKIRAMVRNWSGEFENVATLNIADDPLAFQTDAEIRDAEDLYLRLHPDANEINPFDLVPLMNIRTPDGNFPIPLEDVRWLPFPVFPNYHPSSRIHTNIIAYSEGSFDRILFRTYGALDSAESRRVARQFSRIFREKNLQQHLGYLDPSPIERAMAVIKQRKVFNIVVLESGSLDIGVYTHMTHLYDDTVVISTVVWDELVTESMSQVVIYVTTIMVLKAIINSYKCDGADVPGSDSAPWWLCPLGERVKMSLLSHLVLQKVETGPNSRGDSLQRMVPLPSRLESMSLRGQSRSVYNDMSIESEEKHEGDLAHLRAEYEISQVAFPYALFFPLDYNKISDRNRNQVFIDVLFLSRSVLPSKLHDIMHYSTAAQIHNLVTKWKSFELVISKLVKLNIPLRVLGIDNELLVEIVKAASISAGHVHPLPDGPDMFFYGFGMGPVHKAIVSAAKSAMCVLLQERSCDFKEKALKPALLPVNVDATRRRHSILFVKINSGKIRSRLKGSKVYGSIGLITLNYSWRWRISKRRSAKDMFFAMSQLEILDDGALLQKHRK